MKCTSIAVFLPVCWLLLPLPPTFSQSCVSLWPRTRTHTPPPAAAMVPSKGGGGGGSETAAHMVLFARIGKDSRTSRHALGRRM